MAGSCRCRAAGYWMIGNDVWATTRGLLSLFLEILLLAYGSPIELQGNLPAFGYVNQARDAARPSASRRRSQTDAHPLIAFFKHHQAGDLVRVPGRLRWSFRNTPISGR